MRQMIHHLVVHDLVEKSNERVGKSFLQPVGYDGSAVVWYSRPDVSTSRTTLSAITLPYALAIPTRGRTP